MKLVYNISVNTYDSVVQLCNTQDAIELIDILKSKKFKNFNDAIQLSVMSQSVDLLKLFTN